MDLTQYGTSPYADPRNRRQVQGFLPSLLRGFLGREESGSVLEPGALEARSTNNLGQGASVLSDLLPYGAAAKGAGKLAGLAGIFIGPKAKTWDRTAAALAESLRGLGKSPEAIRRATGVSWGVDGLPRQEISDDLAQLRGAFLDKPTPRPLSENLEHPALYEAYPELLRMKSTVGFGPVSGEYHEGRILASAPDPSKAKSVVLHEAQHGIQELENFARGGSPSEFLKQAQWAAKARGLDPSWAEKKAYQDYLRLAGETEARMVQARRMLSPEERRQYAPEPDIPEHLQKVLRYDNTAAAPAAKATVWHGSPHKFDAFDSSKIGTGEGAQAYGHGLYLADSPEVAKGYVPKTAHNDTVRRFLDNLPEDAEVDEVIDLLGKGHFTDEQENVIKALRNNDWLGFDYPSQAISQAYRPSLKNFDAPDVAEAVKNAGHLYKVDLPDEHIAKMLDWDKPLSQQAPDVQAAVANYHGVPTDDFVKMLRLDPDKFDKTGKEIMEQRASDSHTRMLRADDLRKAGIPGVRYLDGGSRQTGQGTSNYVVFPGNEDILKILERNGELVNQLRK